MEHGFWIISIAMFGQLLVGLIGLFKLGGWTRAVNLNITNLQEGFKELNTSFTDHAEKDDTRFGDLYTKHNNLAIQVASKVNHK